MDVIPTIRAAQTRISPDRARELRTMPYADYLQSPEWRLRRNARLRAVGFRCEQCHEPKGLQVHHVTYERRGQEWDTDLEVLCADCHEGIHRQVFREQNLAVYVMLVSEAIRAGHGESFADLREAACDLCRQHRIPSDYRRIDRAISQLGSNRVSVVIRRPPVVITVEAAPFSRADAAEALRWIGNDLPVIVRGVPQRTSLPPAAIEAFRQSTWDGERRPLWTPTETGAQQLAGRSAKSQATATALLARLGVSS